VDSAGYVLKKERRVRHPAVAVAAALLAVALAVAPALAQGHSNTSSTSSPTSSSTTSSTSTSSTSTTRPGAEGDRSPGGSTPSTVCQDAAGGSSSPKSEERGPATPGGPSTGCATPASPSAGPAAGTAGTPAVRPAASRVGGGGARPRALRRKRAGVRLRRPARARPAVARVFTGPVVHVVRRSLPRGGAPPAAVGALGPVVTGPLPLSEDEEYVGGSPRLVMPRLAGAMVVLAVVASLWERRKDRRVHEARRALTSRFFGRQRMSEPAP
jgi:hypothetical protein